QNQLDAVLNSMSEALIEIGIDSQIQRANTATETILGIPLGRVVGHDAFEFARFFVAADSDELSVLNALRHCEGICSGDCRFLRDDGQEIYLHWVISPLEFNDVSRGRLLTLVDLSVNRDLRMTLFHEREDFLAVLNHRLRTPLLASDRVIKLILEGQFGGLGEKQEELLMLLCDNISEINRLMVMIMDIYRYRNGSKALELRQVNIDDFLRRLLLKFPVSRVPISLRLECPKTIFLCDESQVTCMLQHVIDNAVKYARSSVCLIVSKKGQDQIQFSVEDDGEGIADADIRNIFERFYLVSASGKYAPVTGAGLCLCSEIAKAHGGLICCTSTVGTGTRFDIHLPLRVQS
ncbi:MAG: PAS domain-containing sensor histidine kinase, partial [Candidatus Obscuribacterales bacterium]|nr:PAS domain-containing sensor histidine kinase [Candidatus Obscuribacterales bacterium]